VIQHYQEGALPLVLVQVRCIQATLGDVISSTAQGDGAGDAAAPVDVEYQEVQVATVDSFQVGAYPEESSPPTSPLHRCEWKATAS
jgi:hypothetical protein